MTVISEDLLSRGQAGTFGLILEEFGVGRQLI